MTEKPLDGEEGVGESEAPEIYAIKKDGDGFSLSRRAFVAVPAAVAVIGCRPENPAVSPTHVSPAHVAGRCSGLNAHSQAVSSLAITADRTLLVSGSHDKTIKLWSLPDGALRQTLHGHMNAVVSLGLGADGKVLASGSSDHTIKLWSLPDGALRQTLPGHVDSGLPLTPSVNRRRGRRLDAQTGVCIALSANGDLLVSDGDDNAIKLWSLPDGTQRQTLQGHTDAVLALALSPDGRLLASGSKDHSVKLWSLPDGTSLNTLVGHSSAVGTVALSADGKLLASGSDDTTINLWSLPDGVLLNTLHGHSSAVGTVAISADGKLLVSGSDDMTIKLWSLPGGILLKTLQLHPSAVLAVALSADGNLLASGSKDSTVKLWSLPDGKNIGCIFDPTASAVGAKVIKYRATGPETITQPCGTPIPPGAACICNCVAGSVTYPGTRSVCVCDTVTAPEGDALPAGAVCVCHSVTVRQREGASGLVTRTKDGVCDCNLVCSCDTVCTCQSICSCESICTCQSVGTGGGHYWFPN
jgi:hypothetical protein